MLDTITAAFLNEFKLFFANYHDILIIILVCCVVIGVFDFIFRERRM